MKRLLVVIAAALLAACASLGPRSVFLSEADLAARLQREFPRQQRLLELIEVTVDAPRLRLLPERNRIATDLDFAVSDRLSGRAPIRGSMAMDYALRFEPSDATLRLSEVRVDRVDFDGAAAALPVTAQRLGGLLAERLLDDMVVWRAQPEQLERLRAVGLDAGGVNVTARGVELALARR